jgi:HK97 family phage prohead protease
MQTETRIFGDLRLEQRAGEKGRRLVGYAAVFNTETDIAGVFREQIAPGAFRGSLARDDIRALVDHEPGRVLGRTRSGTLRLLEDDTGLRFEIDPPDTQVARDLMALVDRGDVSGCSFGFVARGEAWDHKAEPPLRTLTEIELMEISIVTFPAYPETGVALRSLSRTKAKAIAEKIEANLSRREGARNGKEARG